MKSELERLSEVYERAEAEFIDAVRAKAKHQDLAKAARSVADAASRFNAEAYTNLHAGAGGAWMPLDQLTERTEVLADLWRDLATAYED